MFTSDDYMSLEQLRAADSGTEYSGSDSDDELGAFTNVGSSEKLPWDWIDSAVTKTAFVDGGGTQNAENSDWQVRLNSAGKDPKEDSQVETLAELLKAKRIRDWWPLCEKGADVVETDEGSVKGERELAVKPALQHRVTGFPEGEKCQDDCKEET